MHRPPWSPAHHEGPPPRGRPRLRAPRGPHADARLRADARGRDGGVREKLTAVSRPHEGADFFISGYPSALAVPEKTAVRGVLLTLETRQIPTPSDAIQPVDPQVDYFFDAGPNVFNGEYADLEING